MKEPIIALTGFALLSFVACDNAVGKIQSSSDNSADTILDVGTVDAEGTPVFDFVEESFDFGKIKEGEIVEHDFIFENSGDALLIITNAQGSCGCTVPKWPREPIAPGKESLIKVSFNSSGKTGNQSKTITLSANTVPNTKVLKISATVQPKTESKTETAIPAQDANS